MGEIPSTGFKWTPHLHPFQSLKCLCVRQLRQFSHLNQNLVQLLHTVVQVGHLSSFPVRGQHVLAVLVDTVGFLRDKKKRWTCSFRDTVFQRTQGVPSFLALTALIFMQTDLGMKTVADVFWEPHGFIHHKAHINLGIDCDSRRRKWSKTKRPPLVRVIDYHWRGELV